MNARSAARYLGASQYEKSTGFLEEGSTAEHVALDKPTYLVLIKIKCCHHM